MQTWQAVLAASAAGLIAITVYLVVERSFATGTPILLATKQLLLWDASNAFGLAAFSAGWGMAAIGLLMDVVVSTCWAAVFAVAYVKSTFVQRNTVIAGLVFGAIVMVVMIYLVVPIGHAPPPPRTAATILNTLVAHTVFFGLPVAATVRYNALAMTQPESVS